MTEPARFRQVPLKHELITISPSNPFEPSISLLVRAEQAGLQCTNEAIRQLIQDMTLFADSTAIYRLPSVFLVRERYRQQKVYEEAMRKKGCKPLPERVFLDWVGTPETFPAGYFLIASRPRQLVVIKPAVGANIMVQTQPIDNTIITTYDWLAVPN